MRLLTLPWMTHTKVRGVQVDISEATIRCTLFGPKYQFPRTTIEFDHRLRQTRDKVLMRDPAGKADLMR